jgi:hypothetical protein
MSFVPHTIRQLLATAASELISRYCRGSDDFDDVDDCHHQRTEGLKTAPQGYNRDCGNGESSRRRNMPADGDAIQDACYTVWRSANHSPYEPSLGLRLAVWCHLQQVRCSLDLLNQVLRTVSERLPQRLHLGMILLSSNYPFKRMRLRIETWFRGTAMCFRRALSLTLINIDQ